MSDITGHTRIFGILADPIHHVKTPQGINRVLGEQQIDGVLIPIHVPAAGLTELVQGLRRMNNLSGFIVTVPHKTAMPALCDELTPAAARIGAVNAVRRMADGRLIGAMLDGEGFVAGLRSEGIEPRGRSVYLAGAGGGASAIAFALAQSGVTRLTIANRTATRAVELVARLARDFPEVAIAVGTTDPSGHDLVINATSSGLHEDDELPLETGRLASDQIVAEIIMQPAQTKLLRMAAERGCRIHYGAPMLACQIELMAVFMGAFGLERAAAMTSDKV